MNKAIKVSEEKYKELSKLEIFRLEFNDINNLEIDDLLFYYKDSVNGKAHEFEVFAFIFRTNFHIYLEKRRINKLIEYIKLD